MDPQENSFGLLMFSHVVVHHGRALNMTREIVVNQRFLYLCAFFDSTRLEGVKGAW